MDIAVITDSVASIPPDTVADLGIEVVSLYVHEADRDTRDTEMDLDDFYRRIGDTKGALPTSSQPCVEELVQAFRSAVERGCAVIGVFISRAMSGTCETAALAARMVCEEHPHARIEIVDSRSNSMQEGFVAIAAAQAARAGETFDRCLAAANETVRRTRYLFTPASLEYLRRGGRIGSASALLAGLLQVKPILTVENGETTTFAKVRTTGRALAEMARKFAEDVRESGLADVVVHFIGDRAPAERFARELIDPIAGFAVRVVPVSAVVGVHVGPAVAVCYQTERELRP